MSAAFQALLLLLSRHMHRQLIAENQFLKVENEILRKKCGKIILDRADRARLMKFGKALGRRVKDLISVVTYRTWQRWIREEKDGTPRKVMGRPRKPEEVQELVLRMARENDQWGNNRIAGELGKLGIRIDPKTVKNILKAYGLYPRIPPGRSETTYAEFIRRHMDTLVACDFFTKEIRTIFGSFTAYMLVFIHLESRRVWISPSTLHPTGEWTKRQALNYQMAAEDMGIKIRYVIRDRDAKYNHGFDELWANIGVEVIDTPIAAPNCNAFVETQIGHMKFECHNHFWFFTSLEQLGRANSAYMKFHNNFRPHQGKGNCILDPDWEPPPETGAVRCRKFLGGLLRHYYRDAA